MADVDLLSKYIHLTYIYSSFEKISSRIYAKQSTILKVKQLIINKILLFECY